VPIDGVVVEPEAVHRRGATVPGGARTDVKV
jgi:hypothetical protein